MILKRETRNILENLKSVETWEDFAPFLEYWRVPREADDEISLDTAGYGKHDCRQTNDTIYRKKNDKACQ